MLQFCREQALPKTLQALQEETQVTLNIVDDMQVFISDIMAGRWDAVLRVVSKLHLPSSKMIDLYEQIVLEMNELLECDVAKALLTKTECLQQMRVSEPERFVRLEHITATTSASLEFDEVLVYQGTNRDQRRELLAQSLQKEVRVVPPSRLLVLLGQALRYQAQDRSLDQVDIFGVKNSNEEVIGINNFVTSELYRTIKFGSRSYPTTASFVTKAGKYIVTGSVDGFIEVWDTDTGKLNKKTLIYQANDEIMMHDEGDSVTTIACGFEQEGEDKILLASGSRNGHIKIWRLATGDCIKNIAHAHQKSVTAVCFSPYSITDQTTANMILSGGLDGSVRIYGLNTGKLIKQFAGHTSFVNTVAFARDKSGILCPVSGSSDGTVRIWDIKTMEVLRTFMPGATAAIHNQLITEITVHRIVPIQSRSNRQESHLLVCNATTKAYLVDMRGEVIRTYAPSEEGGESVKQVNFVTCTASPGGEYVYLVDEGKELYCFETESGKLLHRSGTALHSKDILGVIHHPSKSMIATHSVDGTLKIWT
jgi:WD40 repeat-containing protein SMU1